jgi:hypothetical protein
MNRVTEWNVISPNVGEDGVRNEGDVQIPKKGYVDWCIKKVRLAYLDLGPVVLSILI